MADIRITKLKKAGTIKGNERVPISQVDPAHPSIINTVYMLPSELKDFASAEIFPSGTIWSYAGIISNKKAPPNGWLLCDGSELPIAEHKSLYAAIQTKYGKTTTPKITFKLPDMKCRFVMGYDNSKSETFLPYVGNYSGSPLTLGQTGGAFNHALTVSEIPNHNHEGTIGPSYITYLSHPFGNGIEQLQEGEPEDKKSSLIQVDFGITMQDAGGGETHSNTPPYVSMHYIIKT